MEEGVIIDDPDSTYIDSTVAIGASTRILPGTHIEGEYYNRSGQHNWTGGKDTELYHRQQRKRD